MSIDKAFDRSPVTSCTPQIVLQTMISTTLIERSLITLPDTVLLGQSLPVFLNHLLRHLGHLGTRCGRNDVQRIQRSHSLLRIHVFVSGQPDGQLLILSERSLNPSVGPVLRCPYHHITPTRCEKRASVLIGVFVDRRIKLRVIIDFKFHLRPFHRFSCGTHHLEVDASSRRIVAHEVDFGIVRRA